MRARHTGKTTHASHAMHVRLDFQLMRVGEGERRWRGRGFWGLWAMLALLTVGKGGCTPHPTIYQARSSKQQR